MNNKEIRESIQVLEERDEMIKELELANIPSADAERMALAKLREKYKDIDKTGVD